MAGRREGAEAAESEEGVSSEIGLCAFRHLIGISLLKDVVERVERTIAQPMPARGRLIKPANIVALATADLLAAASLASEGADDTRSEVVPVQMRDSARERYPLRMEAEEVEAVPRLHASRSADLTWSGGRNGRSAPPVK